MPGDLVELLQKRIAALNYLVSVHNGSTPWMNSIKVSKSDITSVYRSSIKSQPSLPYCNFYLGCSLSLITSRYINLPSLIKALLGAIKEYENINGTSSSDTLTTKKVVAAGRKFFRQRKESLSGRRRSSSGMSSSSSSNITSPISATSSNSTFTGTYYSGTHTNDSASVVLDLDAYPDLHYLTIHHLPFIPDVHETFVSLLETLSASYQVLLQLLEEGSSGQSAAYMNDIHDNFVKFDNRVNKLIISPTIKELDDLSKSLAYEDITRLNTLLVKA